MRVLTGLFDHTVDAKNRIRIPAKLKADLLGEPVEAEDKEQKKFTLVFHLGTGGCVEIYTQEKVDEICSQLTSIKKSDTEKYKAASVYLSTFESVESDPQGRLVIPPMCRKYAKIVKDIVIKGRADHIELWSKARYDEYFGTKEIDVDKMAELESILEM